MKGAEGTRVMFTKILKKGDNTLIPYCTSRFYAFLLCVAGILLLHLYGQVDKVIAILPVCCPFNLITGIPCPGCGMTRAFLALARGDLITALHYNPFSMLLAAIIIFTAFGINLRASDRFKSFLYSIFLTVILIWWFWKRLVPAFV
jgi:hypothetical protein